jgi:hypothetical protein
MTYKLTIQVDHGDGAVSTIPDPLAVAAGGLEWNLRYGGDGCRPQAASVVASFDYLLSDLITLAEAQRRLRYMRNARLSRIAERACDAAIAAEAKGGD